MQRTEIQSKKIKSWAYDEPSKVMEIEYVWGSIIRFFDVLPALVQEFRQAESQGSFLSKHIEYRHDRRKLAEGEDQTGPLDLPPDTAAGKPAPASAHHPKPMNDQSGPPKRRKVKLL